MNSRDRRPFRPLLSSAALAAFLLGPAARAAEFDWPCWRGPEGNGISKEKDWSAEAIAAAGGPKVLWKAEVKNGYSCVAVVGNRLYTMGNENGQDAIICLDADKGTEIWRHAYPCGAGSYEGPRATPTVDGDFVYTLSREGHVFCLKAADGSVKWSRNVIQELGAENIGWGLAGSPLVKGDVVYLNAGESGAALDKNDGKEIWASKGKGGYATPVPFSLKGDACLAIFSAESMKVVKAASGAVVASVPWKTAYDVSAADPIPKGNTLFFSSGYKAGATLVDFSEASPKTAWKNAAVSTHFSSCVLIDDRLYGISGNAGQNGEVRCIDYATGNVVWSQSVGFGSLMAAGDRLIVLTENGTLIAAKASPTAYSELARAKVHDPKGKCWTMPVLCRGRIYIRDSRGNLLCLDVRP